MDWNDFDVDPAFYDRADSHIRLANEQLDGISRGKVSASLMYSQARYAAWLSACGFSSGEEMESAKDETIAYFVEQFTMMLTENLEDYIRNFDTYIMNIEKEH
jgi:hypothetical protein